jgi:cyanophycin synthetase
MEFRRVRALRGPNLWASFPVLEAWVDLGTLKDSPSDELPGFNERLMAWLPSLVEHRCSVGTRGGFFERLRRGTYQAHILEHVALELQSLAGTEVGFGRTRETSEEGVYKVALEYEDEELGRASLHAARDLCLAAVHDRPFDLEAALAHLRELARRAVLPAGTAAILAAARKQQVPVLPLGPHGLFQLGHGVHQRRLWGTQLDQVGGIAESIARDRELTRTLLRAAGVPVPAGRPVSSAEEAWEAACELGLPAVVRPRCGNDHRAVGRDLTTREQVLAAYDVAHKESSQVLVERCAQGGDYRLLVVGDRVVAAARRDAGRGRGATGADVTDRLHPEVAARAVDAARAVGLEVAGIDVVAADVDRPLEEQDGVVVGVHPRPGLRLHLEPSAGGAKRTAATVGEVLLARLFPEGRTGRIPIVGITGVNGKTTTTRLIAHVVARWGRVVGMACTEGIYLQARSASDGTVVGRRIEAGDCSGPLSARALLQNPRVEAAVLETARGGILRAGLGFDRCDVAVVTNIGEGDHLGISDVDTPEQLARVKRTLVETVAPGGAAVLNATDPLVVDMAPYSPGAVVWFAPIADHPVVARHRADKGRAVFVRDNHIVLAEGEQEIRLVSLDRVPLAHGGLVGFQVQNALAAAAAAWSLGVPCEVIRVGLETFVSSLDTTPARFNLLEVRGATVVLDYGHNVSSLACLIEALSRLPHKRRTAVYSAAGDRRDGDLLRQAEQLAGAFDRVVLYEDPNCNRNRKDGEIIALFRKGLAAGGRVSRIEEVQGAVRAVEHALATARPGELVLAQVDLVDQTIDLVRQSLAATGLAREIDFREAMTLGRPKPAVV